MSDCFLITVGFFLGIFKMANSPKNVEILSLFDFFFLIIFVLKGRGP